MEKILLRNVDAPESHTLAAYRSRGGYRALEKVAREMSPARVIEEVKASGLRGRGGAGFPTGMKWGFVPKDSPKPKYVVCNADESEPGTFKDRLLIEKDPHAIIEGTIIAAYSIGSHTAFIYIRGELAYASQVLQKAIDESYQAGYLGKSILGTGYDLDVVLHRGAGAYICGEETGLLSSLEGGKGWPKVKPPFPATHGLFGCPTVVNNVETLAALPWIIDQGAAQYAALGTEKSKGTKLFSVSGHIRKPGVYEVEMGYPFKRFLEEDCGGVPNGRHLKGVIPGGASMPVLRADEIGEVRMDYESFQAAGTMLGSGGVIVMDETTCMVKAAWNIARFFAHESCGQCSPCREGCHWMEKIFWRVENGQGESADLDLILNISGNIMGNTICPFGDAAAMPAAAFIKKYRAEFEAHIAEKRCVISASG
ncbi:MAG: NADH oxidoreductase (quinone) subunit F [Deltaproteobacteria bacterium GWA2_57_13]|nr:MAG: NADH oxidoreductase (quinone) subunit F [Deltaproteobacteria bacterium GWA2_57_13]OGQ52600.1 MAG: NADH oxidoreductase (quinone) subunit F [Deltaproteobacteria bacterium RIFCSPLOWO2_02_FULL_57_26]OGQ84104.1 MAG: NADH oxidoreductase (quinone) subunit F [Deltaproteobacteria bacterium RIFCSPLOWO2_12_FULL_57_22]